MIHPRQAMRAEHDPEGTRGGGAQETVRVKLLGGLRVSVGSWVVGERGWRLKKAASLVKLLALAPDHRLHREQVMEWLWPDQDPRAAANNLRHALHVARRVLEPTPDTASRHLQSRGGQLMLCPKGPVWVDVEAFEEAVVRAPYNHEPAVYRAALDLYAADLLPEDRYEAWAEDRREGLCRAYLGLLLELAGLCEECGDFESAIEALGKVVASEPAHEEAHASLMRLYAKSGRRHEAILQYEKLRKGLGEGLGIEPREASRRLYERIRTGGLPVDRPPTEDRAQTMPFRPPLHNLPVARTSFVGREREVVEVKRELAMTRLLTLTGAGGSGKTRLALEVAKDLLGTYPDGAWLIELAALSEEVLVPQAVAAALGMREQPGRPLTDTLVDALRENKMLLVLDNCEHLIDAVAQLAETLLGSCPGLRVLATSREAFSIVGESVWQVPSLSVPDSRHPSTVEYMAGFESVRLFVERARRRASAFVLTPRNVRAVVEICWRLDGIPLAIELAAARARVLSVEQIAERLDDCFRLLTVGSRTALLRHRTLRATIDWSYELLSEDERRLFRRLAVFAGGFTLEMAEAICSGENLKEDEVLDLLSHLVEKSLVVVQELSGEMRYRLLETVRQYGWEKLEESGEVDPIRRRHANFFLALAQEIEPRIEPKIHNADRHMWLERLEIEHGNLRAALRWAVDMGKAETGLRLASALFWFWHMRGYLKEGRSWFDRALAEVPERTAVRAEALYHTGYLAFIQ